jgi:WD40 repeat protein
VPWFGKKVLTGSTDHSARAWNVDGSGEPVVLRGHSNAVWSVAFSPDGCLPELCQRAVERA